MSAKVPPCKVCHISLKAKCGRVSGRVIITKKGERGKPIGYCFEHAPKWDAEHARMVEYGEERYQEIVG